MFSSGVAAEVGGVFVSILDVCVERIGVFCAEEFASQSTIFLNLDIVEIMLKHNLNQTNITPEVDAQCGVLIVAVVAAKLRYSRRGHE